MKNKKQKKISLRLILIGSFMFVSLFAFGLIQNASVDLKAPIEDYFTHKQEISDTLGSIENWQYQNMPLLPDKKQSYDLKIKLIGSKETGTLNLKATYQKNHWHIENIGLKTQDRNLDLQAAYTSQTQIFAASTSSGALTEPVFYSGENILLQTYLKTMPQAYGFDISQSIAIYDDNDELVTAIPHVANFQAKTIKDPEKGIRFNNKITDLKPGRYSLLMQYTDQNSTVLESFWQDLWIQEAPKTLIVKSVQYFKDQNYQDLIEPEFDPKQDIYLRLSLSGFKPADEQIAGVVDLQIKNAKGDVVAYKPKFVSFNNEYQATHGLVVDGHFKLNEPDIYFLSFKVRDHFTKQSITHNEKIIVKLP